MIWQTWELNPNTLRLWIQKRSNEQIFKSLFTLSHSHLLFFNCTLVFGGYNEAIWWANTFGYTLFLKYLFLYFGVLKLDNWRIHFRYKFNDKRFLFKISIVKWCINVIICTHKIWPFCVEKNFHIIYIKSQLILHEMRYLHLFFHWSWVEQCSIIFLLKNISRQYGNLSSLKILMFKT